MKDPRKNLRCANIHYEYRVILCKMYMSSSLKIYLRFGIRVSLLEAQLFLNWIDLTDLLTLSLNHSITQNVTFSLVDPVSVVWINLEALFVYSN